MANRNRGEVSFKARGKPYTLRLDVNAICDLEDAFDRGIADIAAVFQAGARMTHLRKAFAAILKIEETEAGEVIDALGVAEAAARFGEAMELAFPPADDSGRPPKAGHDAKTGSPN